MKEKKRKLSIQKIFNTISGVFILTCIIFYGIRFIKLYRENNSTNKEHFIADTIKENNKETENLKNINGEFYFYGNAKNNYISYSNLLWRIIKISPDNTVTIALNNSITPLAKGDLEFNNSNIYNWLNKNNKENTGILENSLNDIQTYLTYTKTCNDEVEDTKNITCKNQTQDIYITIPSLNDYINTGSRESFLNNGEYYYLINKADSKNTWCIDKDGKISTSDGLDILGIKPVITIKSPIKIVKGDGTKESPYIIENKTNLIGSYIKLDNDIWRVYKEEGEYLKLSLDNYLTINNEEIKYKYSNNNYKYNDKTLGSLAYYLNKNYLSTLKYKNLLEETSFSNGIYSNTNNYDYTKVFEETINTKVTVLSIGDIILNPSNTNYYLSTGISKDSNMIYTMQNDFKVYTKVSTTNLKIVPVIAIKKDLVTSIGTKESPFEVHYE